MQCSIYVQNKFAIAARRGEQCPDDATTQGLFPLKDGGFRTLPVCLFHSVNLAVNKFCEIIKIYDRKKNKEELEKMGIKPQDSVDMLKNYRCQCMNDKAPGQPFCNSCYKRLPKAIQKALYQRIGFGFEQSYKLACDILKGK